MFILFSLSVVCISFNSVICVFKVVEEGKLMYTDRSWQPGCSMVKWCGTELQMCSVGLSVPLISPHFLRNVGHLTYNSQWTIFKNAYLNASKKFVHQKNNKNKICAVKKQYNIAEKKIYFRNSLSQMIKNRSFISETQCHKLNVKSETHTLYRSTTWNGQ